MYPSALRIEGIGKDAHPNKKEKEGKRDSDPRRKATFLKSASREDVAKIASQRTRYDCATLENWDS